MTKARTWIRAPEVRGFLESERARLRSMQIECGGNPERGAACSNPVAYRCRFEYHAHNRPPVHVRRSLCASCARAWVVWVDTATARNVPDIDRKIETLPELDYDDRQTRLWP